jgi:hypothetical protein
VPHGWEREDRSGCYVLKHDDWLVFFELTRERTSQIIAIGSNAACTSRRIKIGSTLEDLKQAYGDWHHDRMNFIYVVPAIDGMAFDADIRDDKIKGICGYDAYWGR